MESQTTQQTDFETVLEPRSPYAVHVPEQSCLIDGCAKFPINMSVDPQKGTSHSQRAPASSHLGPGAKNAGLPFTTLLDSQKGTDDTNVNLDFYHEAFGCAALPFTMPQVGSAAPLAMVLDSQNETRDTNADPGSGPWIPPPKFDKPQPHNHNIKVTRCLDCFRPSQPNDPTNFDFRKQQKNIPPKSTNVKPSSMNADFYRYLRSGKIESLELVLEENLGDQVTPRHNTALHIVARHGVDQLIEPILKQHPSLLSKPNLDGDTALHLAAEAGLLASVKIMVDFAGDAARGTLCERTNNANETPLHVALRQRHTSVALHLVSAHPKVSYWLNERDESPLFLAAKLGELHIVQKMFSNSDGIDIQRGLTEGKSVVHAAILGGNPSVLVEILSKQETLPSSTSFSVNGADMSFLSFAAENGNIQMVRHLMRNFPDSVYTQDSMGTFPIHKAAAKGYIMVLEEFLKFHPDSTELLALDGRNILHMAAFHGKDDVVSYLLSKPDFDDLINVKDKDGNTPLHCAVAKKSPKVVDALTWDQRVRLDLVNNDGYTPMDLALNIKNAVPSLKEQLTWLALRYAHAPKRNFVKGKRSDESEKATIKTFKDRVNTLTVVATLVTTMSFAAGFTIPGGNNGSDPNQGMAIFLKRRIFHLFVISNSIALYTSVLDVLVLIFAMLGDAKMLQASLKVAVPLLATSLATVSIGFMSAGYLVVSTLKWLGILIWLMGSVYLTIVVSLFFLLFPPLSAKSRFTRYLAYPPFRAMLYICEGK